MNKTIESFIERLVVNPRYLKESNSYLADKLVLVDGHFALTPIPIKREDYQRVPFRWKGFDVYCKNEIKS